MKYSILSGIILLVILFITGSLLAQSTRDWSKKGYTSEAFEYKDLAAWVSYGRGAIEANHGQTVMYETKGSLGYMLVSPKSYGESTIVSFDVMTLNAATVLVVELAAHNDDNLNLTFDSDYDGKVQYLFDHIKMYMFAFHNAAHNKKGPFVRKYPEPGTEPLAAASKHVMDVGKYHHVEIGMDKETLWFKANGKRVWKVKDPNYYKGGKFIFRIRGTAHETASCIIKDLVIKSK